jgi:pilus assembly protein CpaB
MFRVVFLTVALAAGGAAGWLAFAMRPAPAVATVVPVAPAAPTQYVLVASVDLGRGQALTRENLRWQSWPDGALNPAYISRAARPDALETLAGSIVRSRVTAGEPVRDQMLVPLNAGFLSATLPPGKRAVAVRISPENTAGGFILPDDRVDVISTVALDGQGEGEKQHVSRTILRNIPVLAIDQTLDEKVKDEKAKDEKAKDEKGRPRAVVVGRTATLEVDPLQAEILAAGEATGTLSLALRSAADNNSEVQPVSLRRSSPQVQVLRGGRTDVAKTP